jgi:4-hydroxy-4-methyl-2-oxoglutarate aldolase
MTAPPPDAIVEGFRVLPTAAVSDALDRLGLPGSAWGITPLSDGARIAGRAFTVRYVPVGAGGGTVGDFLDDVPPGAVVVIANNGRTDCTVWGDIMTTVALARGVAGTVIDGVCRDVSLALDRAYPLFTRGRFMRTGKDRVTVVEVGAAVTLCDVQVAPGDVVLGNADGVVVVPRAREVEVLEIARGIEAAEQLILSDVRDGLSLKEARARRGYHALQSKGTAP